MGVVLWPMVELEADDALAGAAARMATFKIVRRVYICSPDKDLAQCVRKTRIVMMDRRRNKIIDEKGVVEKYGVPPSSIPDYLALVGDTADGYPGLEGWGEKSAGMVLAEYHHLEKIPWNVSSWKVQPRSVNRLASTLRENMNLALLFRDLATLRTQQPAINSPDELFWRGPSKAFARLSQRLDAPQLVDRIAQLKR